MRHLRGKAGFTIIELMVALAVGALITAAAYQVLVDQGRIYEVQDQTATMQQGARAAMDFLCRELRHAGYGVPVDTGGSVFTNFVNNDAADANIDNGTDSLTFRANTSRGSVVAVDAAAASTTLSVYPAPGRASDFQVNDQVIIMDWDKKQYLTGITVSAVAYTNLTQPTQLTCTALGAPVLAGYLVGVTPATITYRVRNNVLERVDAAAPLQPQALIENVEDLQLVYAFDANDDGELDTSAGAVIWAVDTNADGRLDQRVLDNGTLQALGSTVDIGGSSTACAVRAVRVTLVARTARQNPDPRFRTQYRRPRAEDHAAAAAPDGFRRVVLQNTVKFRNLGL